MRLPARAFGTASAALLLATCDDPAPVTAPPRPAGAPAAAVGVAGTAGAWAAPITWPIVAAHMTVLPDTRVLAWVSSDMPGDPERHRVYTWDATTGALSELTGHTHNVFCSSHTFLDDGRLLVAGGHIADNKGLKQAKLFDHRTNGWLAVPSMDAGRWYPTSAMLANGEVVLVAGSDENASGNLYPEVYNAATNSWRLLRGAPLNMPYYPWTYAAPDGRAFVAGPDQDARYLNPSGGGAWSAPVPSAAPFREWGSSVMYRPGKVLIVGGGADAPTNSAEVIDLNAAAPAWRATGAMTHARKHLNTVVLPDGRVLAVGGTAGPGFNNEARGVRAAEVWDPATGAWTVLASMATPHRLYHSSAVLLADGRVLLAGGGRCGACTVNNLSAEIFSPPYLFNADGTPVAAAARPAITSAPAEVNYGQTFTVQTPSAAAAGAAAAARVTLVRLPATTHSFNQNQGFDSLAFSVQGGALAVTAPASAHRLQPGHYLLFVVNAAGVPSVAKVVRLRGAAALPPAPAPPAEPSGLRVTAVNNTNVRVQWADNSANETEFLVQRCQGAGCTAFAEVARATANATTVLDGGLTPTATYAYRVRARNEAGASAYTAPVAVTLPADAQAVGVAIAHRAAGTCMSAVGNAQTSGTPIELTSCAAPGSQTWLVPAAGTSGPIRNYSDKCLDARGGGGGDGDVLIFWDCHGQANQTWRRTAAGELRGVFDKCVRVVGDPAVEGARLDIGPCTGGADQRWDVGPRATDSPPVAAFTAACTGLQCSFNSAASADDQGIASRRWDYGDGTGDGNTINVFHNYPAAAADRTYTVTLTVTDGAGQTGVATRTVLIAGQGAPANAPPVARITAPATCGRGRPCQFADASTDADGAVAARQWTFGDAAGGASTAQNPAYTYAAVGRFTVRLAVTDNQGATNATTATVDVVEPPSEGPIVSQSSGKCLDAAGGGGAVGDPMIPWDCHGGANQQWRFTAAGELRGINNRCLDASGGSGADGDRLILWNCHGQANQRWRLTAAGELRGINDKCVVPVGDVAVNGTPLAIGPCTGAADQKWRVP